MSYHISINPFAEYLEATEARRLRILKEQQEPDPIRIPYYQLARARIKKSIELNGSHAPINSGIKALREKKPKEKWQKNDIINSIVALENFKKMLLSDLIKNNDLEIISPKQKHINFNGISINISPNIIFRITVDGNKYIGACKIHISKGKPFTHKQSKLVANLIEQYLSNCIAEENDEVDPVLCFCLDPFAGTTINSNSKVVIDMKVVKQLCDEIKRTLDGSQTRSNVA